MLQKNERKRGAIFSLNFSSRPWLVCTCGSVDRSGQRMGKKKGAAAS